MPFNTNEALLPDEVLHMVCAQISADYQKFIRHRIFPRMKLLEKLSYRDLSTLMLISRKNGQVSPSEIADILRLDPSTISRAVQILSDKGMIAVTDNDLDSRSLILEITDKGLGLLNEYEENFHAAIDAMEEKFDFSVSQAEWDLITKVLYRFRERSSKFGEIAQSRIKLYF